MVKSSPEKHRTHARVLDSEIECRRTNLVQLLRIFVDIHTQTNARRVVILLQFSLLLLHGDFP